MKNKKIILISVIGLFIIGFISLYNSLKIVDYESEIRKPDNYFNKTLKRLVPKSIKDYMKDTIFVFKKVSFLEQQLEDRRKELADKNKQLIKNNNIILNILNDLPFFEFKKNEIKKKKLYNVNLSLKTFTFPALTLTGPRSYLSYYNQNLFMITGTGILMYTQLDNIKDEIFVFKRIDSNFKDLVDINYITKKTKGIVKNLLIKNNKIYVSYVKKVKDKCFTNAILVANLNFEKIIFNEFFDTNECSIKYSNGAGGNLSDFKDDKILMTIGDYQSYERTNQKNNNPQNINSLIGKIISIDEKTKEYKILSMGHRNPQGLYYDKENNIIYSTEHGPQGGDEINVNTSPDGKIKNYGWGVSSYGAHYPSADNSEKYKIAPLHKSHAKYGFIEPLKYFTPSIATSQIIKTEKFIKIPNKNIIYVGAMGNKIEEGDLSIHQFILDTDLKIEQHNIIPVGERVRDMIYIEELNKMLLFLESSGSMGVLEVEN